MQPYEKSTTLTEDGVLTLTDLPFHAGDTVEVIVKPSPAATPSVQHSLRGMVARYDRPTEPVAETDWEALR